MMGRRKERCSYQEAAMWRRAFFTLLFAVMTGAALLVAWVAWVLHQ